MPHHPQPILHQNPTSPKRKPQQRCFTPRLFSTPLLLHPTCTTLLPRASRRKSTTQAVGENRGYWRRRVSSRGWSPQWTSSWVLLSRVRCWVRCSGFNGENDVDIRNKETMLWLKLIKDNFVHAIKMEVREANVLINFVWLVGSIN